MGKYERIGEIVKDLTATELIRPGDGAYNLRLASFIYHRELALRKIIECLLGEYTAVSSIAISIEQLADATGNIRIENIDANSKIQVSVR